MTLPSGRVPCISEIEAAAVCPQLAAFFMAASPLAAGHTRARPSALNSSRHGFPVHHSPKPVKGSTPLSKSLAWFANVRIRGTSTPRQQWSTGQHLPPRCAHRRFSPSITSTTTPPRIAEKAARRKKYTGGYRNTTIRQASRCCASTATSAATGTAGRARTRRIGTRRI